MLTSTRGKKKGARWCHFLFTMSEEKTAITDKHCLQNVLILAFWDDVNPVFDHSPRAIFQIYLHYKTVWWKKKNICCALIADYHNPVNKHLSCQHLQYELLLHDCDAIWISPHAIFHVKKSLSHVLLIKCDKTCSQDILLATGSEADTI